jgi:hypothetical protein
MSAEFFWFFFSDSSSEPEWELRNTFGNASGKKGSKYSEDSSGNVAGEEVK